MPHALVTGGASGLGLGCALRFARLGYEVTIADVDARAGNAALGALAAVSSPGARQRLEPVDLAEPASIEAMAQRLLARGEPVDVLVNNAGIYPPSRRTLTAEGHELTFAIAHLGHFRLSHALWPLLLRAPAARVISVSSLVQRRATLDLEDLSLARGYSPIRAYAQAKLACLLFTLELQRRLTARQDPVVAYAAHPGVCRTQLGRNRRLAPGDSRWQRFASWLLANGLGRFGQAPERGAESILEAATTTRYAPGSFIGPRGFLEIAGPPGLVAPGPAATAVLAAALWQRTEDLVGSRWLA